MLKKYRIKNIFIFFTFFVLFLKLNFCLAQTVDTNKDSYEDIYSSLEYMRQNIKYIDERISEMKKTDAYDNYPAVRLNVETPLFGINSIMKNKLLIKENVATTDIISGYSVYDIARTNKIKVPTLSVGSVIVSTREINLNENITSSDVNSCLSTLVSAMEVSKEAKSFIDEYINKNFNEYIENDIKERIKKAQENNNNLKFELEKNQNGLIMLKILNSEKYNELYKEYNNIYNVLYSNTNRLDNILISEYNLRNIEISMTDIKERIKNLSSNIEAEKINLNNDLEYILKKFIYESNCIINEIKFYIGNSYDLVSIEDLKDINNKISIETDSNDGNNKIVTNYIITFENVIDSMELILREEYEELENYRIKNKVYEYDSVEYDEILNKYIDNYKKILNEETRFYTVNYDHLLSDALTKLSIVIDYTDEYISNDYIFINFYCKNEIKDLNKKYNGQDYMNNLSKLNFYKSNINSLIKRYQNINFIYNSLTQLGKIS